MSFEIWSYSAVLEHVWGGQVSGNILIIINTCIHFGKYIDYYQYIYIPPGSIYIYHQDEYIWRFWKWWIFITGARAPAMEIHNFPISKGVPQRNRWVPPCKGEGNFAAQPWRYLVALTPVTFPHYIRRVAQEEFQHHRILYLMQPSGLLLYAMLVYNTLQQFHCQPKWSILWCWNSPAQRA